MRRPSVLAALTALTALTAVASPAAAQFAPGSRLTFSGVADATDIGSPGVVLSFTRRVVASRTGNTEGFASLNRTGASGVSGAIRQIVVGSGPQNVPGFLVLGGFRFDLLALPSGAYGQDECYVDPAPGQRCTPYQFPSFALSPFYLLNEASGNPDAPINTVIAFDLFGTVRGPGNTRTDFTGTISTAFAGVSFQEALYGLEQFGLQGVPFTATIVTGAPSVVAPSLVPEPSTYALLATGLAGILGVARRRRRA